jgi:purine-nucleoside phosphorylase
MGSIDLGRPSTVLPYPRIPHFPRPSAAGHPGELALCGGVAVLRGRVHYYEGRSLEEVVRPVRAMARLGVRTLVVTNAAGAVNRTLRPGDLMLIADHLNLMGDNPLRGGAGFTDLSEAYDRGLRAMARRAARKAGFRLREGVYAAVPGPCYETPAEVRMLRRLGADAVGMSTVPEVIAAVQAGMRVLGISLVANLGAGLRLRPGGKICHGEVLEAARRATPRLQSLLRTVIVSATQER